MHKSCHAKKNDNVANGLKAVSLLLRLANMALAITSAAIMATAGGRTINKNDDATTSITFTFKTTSPLGAVFAGEVAYEHEIKACVSGSGRSGETVQTLLD
ncbi:hypothetical protein PR202_gb13342 [Eleusine coracana subsp. coracana]|uniref:Uncharacterized protein n=1 Tax=Eleusine coracana subsp. coracana TaxID=191504 RepID=A0AAV5ESZ9_ELECO|nr:hypothetical protein PR202_gb13342 [Eleusine coracana subsp. coracana]